MFQKRRVVTVTRAACNTIICTGAPVADSVLSRMVGLLQHKSLSFGAGMWLLPASSVHTFGMRFSIDLVALDEDLRVAALYTSVAPGRVVRIPAEHYSVLELAAGRVRSTGLLEGDTLRIEAMNPLNGESC